MTKLLFINFIRSKGYLIGLLILLLSGLLSLHIGKRFLEKYDTTIDKTAHFQQETIDRYVNYVSDDLGLLLYYLRFGLVNEMPNITALSIGHRDVNPSIMNVTIRNLEEQKYNTDLINPMYQLLGNMDFSFVLIYLFPLVIIAFCFNLMSEEKEAGTWNLLRSQTKSPGGVMRVKMGIRLLAVSMVLLLILGIAKVYLAIEFDALFLAFSVSGILYIVFWFSLCWFVISLHKNSSQNALILLIAWLILTIVVPTTVNSVISHAYPVREAFETLVENRNSYHKKWDEPKQPTIQKFKAHYPQFSGINHEESQTFSWIWYYAMHQMGDDEAAPYVLALKDKLKKREDVSRSIGMFFPTIHTQLTLNELTLADINNQLRFWKATEDFHEQKRLYFYPKIFSDFPVLQENWKQFTLGFFKDRASINWWKNILPLLLISVVLIITGNKKI